MVALAASVIEGSLLEGITAVLCTRQLDAEGFPRVPSLVGSLVRFGVPGTVAELLLSVPEQDVAPLREAFESRRATLWKSGGRWHAPPCRGYLKLVMKRSFSVRVVGDSQVLPSSRELLTSLTPAAERSGGGRGANYRMQMLIKLGIARLVRTRHYLTFDSDVFAKRPFGIADLLVDGNKALIQGEMQDSGSTQHRRSWWEAAARIFHAPGCVKAHTRAIGVTPALLVTAIARNLTARIERLWGQGRIPPVPWDALLFEQLRNTDWTEYTLYYTYACASGEADIFHAVGARRLYDANGFGWGAWQTMRQRLQHEFAGTGAFFGVVQSIGGADPMEVSAAMRPFIVPREDEYNVSMLRR